jgi:signal transduction histidine kinase
MAKLNFTKDKIFSIISHDLRSPIASLQAVLGLLQSKQINVEEFKQATTGLQKQVQQLSNSLDELLTWSRAQLHGIKPAPANIKLKSLVYEVVSVTRISARTKGIIVTTKVLPETEVFCDPNMLKSVITNLLSNAIKFTPVGGAVSLSAGLEGDLVRITVDDTGIGIPAENMEKILNPSVHFSTRGTSNEKGTGLGLAMCREFIGKNNGTFSIQSEDGKGSKFMVMLPARA